LSTILINLQFLDGMEQELKKIRIAWSVDFKKLNQ